ncbi:MAG TPA: AgmX/PglI C-terminal domain-containing protein [Kofleriaceae bacterium]|nr:AgmX/PglI C-terminal domain-containing protein [Kofleriaceae bacterium]
MKRAVPLLFVVACGGNPPPPPEAPPAPPPKRVTRVPIETSDDEPEDGVTFVKQKGTISPEAIQAALEPHQQAMMECYTTRVGKRRFLGGEVRLLWSIKGDGSVKSVKLDSSLGAWDIEKCLLDIAWSATFDRPSGGGSADFDLPFSFKATRSTAIWDEDQALRAVGGQLALLDACPSDDPLHKKAKKGGRKPPRHKPQPVEEPAVPERPEPRPPRNVTITMYVGPLGKAQSIGFSSPTSEVGAKWAACAAQVASSWRLPDPRGQIAKLAVRYKAE